MVKFDSVIRIKKPGYIYVYLTYENESNNYVYFDDLKVTYTKSQVVQSNNYYAFGLQTKDSWTRIDTKPNQYLYNSGSELNKVTGNYEMFFRGYDPAIGRMSGVDMLASSFSGLTPYQYGANNPIRMNDPTGAMTDDTPWAVERSRRGKYQYFDSFADYAYQNQNTFGGGFYTYQNFYGSGWNNQQNNGSSFTGYGVTTAMSDGYVDMILDAQQGDAQALEEYGKMNGSTYIYNKASLHVGPEIGGYTSDKSEWVLQQTQNGPGNPPGLPLGVVETSLMSGGITLPGIGIFVEPNSGNLTKHEVGHYLQFLRDGGSYFKFYKNIGAPSLYNAIEQTFVESVLGIDPSKVGLLHDNFRTETDANKLIFGPTGTDDYPTKTISPTMNWYQRMDVYINILWNTR